MSDQADTIRAGIYAMNHDAKGDPALAALAALDALVAENQRLRDALERTVGALNGELARTPVRDVTETLAEARAALDGTPSKATT